MFDRHTESSNPLTKLYEPVNVTVVPFDSGSKPDFVTEITSGGGSVSYQTTEGGYASLSTGTTSQGDSAKIKTSDISVGPYDAVSISAVFDAEGSIQTQSDCYLGLNPSDGKVIHFLSRNYLDLSDGNNTETKDTHRLKDEALPKRTTLLMDPTEDDIHHRIHNMSARRVNSSLHPSATQTLAGEVSISTQDTSNDRVINIRRLEIGY
jgi:hypothetical protein